MRRTRLTLYFLFLFLFLCWVALFVAAALVAYLTESVSVSVYRCRGFVRTARRSALVGLRERVTEGSAIALHAAVEGMAMVMVMVKVKVMTIVKVKR